MKNNEIDRTCSTHGGDKKNHTKILVGTPEMNRFVGSYTRAREDKIERYLRETGFDDVD
jgi:hypothetical protein